MNCTKCVNIGAYLNEWLIFKSYFCRYRKWQNAIHHALSSPHTLWCMRLLIDTRIIYLIHLRDWGTLRVNSFTAGRFEYNFRRVIFQIRLVIDFLSISCEIALRCLPCNPNDNKSITVSVMAWCHPASSRYLRQCSPKSVSPYDVPRPQRINISSGVINCLLYTVYPKECAHGFCFAVLCCCYTLTDFPISIRLTSLALWQSNDCPSASKATLMNMDKYFMWIHYERLHNHNKAKHNKTVCIFLGIYCT